MTNSIITESSTPNNLIDRLLANVPDELINLPQWVLWRAVKRDGKLTKMPYQRNGQPADSTKPSTWTDFATAIGAYADGGFAGVGFVFSEDDPYCGVDLDKLTEDDERWSILAELDSYSEISQSGKGAHAIVRAIKPGERCAKPKLGIEMYDNDRYFVMTGDILPTSPRTIKNRQTALTTLYRRIWPDKSQSTHSARPMPSVAITGDDGELLKRMFASRHGASIETLYNGSLSAHNENHSSADIALCNHLAFWTGKDAGRMERMFGNSALGQRDKWTQRADYRNRTIARAILDCGQTYEPKQRNESDSNDIAEGGPTFSEQIDARRSYAISANFADKMKLDHKRLIEFTDKNGRFVSFEKYSKHGTDAKVWNALLTAAARRGRFTFRVGLTELRDLAGVGSKTTVSTTIDRFVESGLININDDFESASSLPVEYHLPEVEHYFGQVSNPQNGVSTPPVQSNRIAAQTYAKHMATDPFLSGISRTAKRLGNEHRGLGETILLIIAMVEAYGVMSADKLSLLTGRKIKAIENAAEQAVELGLLVDVDKRGDTVYMMPEIDVWESIATLTPHLKTYRLRAERKDKDLQRSQMWLERQVNDWGLTEDDYLITYNRLQRVKSRRFEQLRTVFDDWTDDAIWLWIDSDKPLTRPYMDSRLESQEREDRLFVIDGDEQDIMRNLDTYRNESVMVTA